jgi:DNA-binding NarL/FixJ family response regulator
VLLDLVREHGPDLAIVGIQMPHATEDLDAALVVRNELPRTAILLLSAHVEVRALDLLRHGPGIGYLLKGRVIEVDGFLEALARIRSGARSSSRRSSGNSRRAETGSTG